MLIKLDLAPPTATTQSSQTILSRGRGPNAKKFVGKKQSKWLVKWLKILMVELLPYRIPDPPQGPIRLSYKLVYPYRSYHRKSVTQKGIRLWKTTRPDCDNTVKAITDTLTKMGFWNDDSQIVDLRVQKMYGPDPYMAIEIQELNVRVDPF